jgi:hypothetical protein
MQRYLHTCDVECRCRHCMLGLLRFISCSSRSVHAFAVCCSIVSEACDPNQSGNSPLSRVKPNCGLISAAFAPLLSFITLYTSVSFLEHCNLAQWRQPG